MPDAVCKTDHRIDQYHKIRPETNAIPVFQKGMSEVGSGSCCQMASSRESHDSYLIWINMPFNSPLPHLQSPAVHPAQVQLIYPAWSGRWAGGISKQMLQFLFC